RRILVRSLHRRADRAPAPEAGDCCAGRRRADRHGAGWRLHVHRFGDAIRRLQVRTCQAGREGLTRMRLRRFVPHSMLSWFALVLVAGISMSLISVSAFHAFNRDEAVVALEDLRAAERIAAAARFLDHSAEPLRPVIAESISGSSLYIAATP